MKRVPISRADLLTTLADPVIAKHSKTAELLGFENTFTAKKQDHNQTEIQKIVVVDTNDANDNTAATPLQHSKTNQLKMRYWQLCKQVNRKDDQQEQSQTSQSQPLPIEPVTWRNRPKKAPTYPTLTHLADIRSRLFSLLDQQNKGHWQIDLPALIDTISRAEFVGELPKKQQSTSLQALHIIDDRQVHLTPYWLDHAWLIHHLYRELACYQISRAVIENGDSMPQLITEPSDWEDYVLPPPQTPILLLSDLGRLTPQATNEPEQFTVRQQLYLRLLRQFTRNQNPVIVLTPCQPSDYPAIIHQQVTVLAWESKGLSLQTLHYTDTDKKTSSLAQQWLEQLLVLLSPAIRVEPELLRSLRQQLHTNEQTMPAAMESLFWQHSSIKEPHSIAATIATNSNKERRKQWAKQSLEQRKLALKTLTQWRTKLPDEIWFEELLSIEPMLDSEELKHYQQDIKDAQCFLQQIVAQEKLSGQQANAYQAWAVRLERRISDSAVAKGSASDDLQRLLQQLHPNRTVSASGHVIDPALRPLPSTLSKQAVWLCQRGNQWLVTQHDPLKIPQQLTSVLAMLEYRQLYIKVQYANGKSQEIALPEQVDNNFVPLAIDKTLLSATEFVLTTDYTECHFKAISKPDWAERMGRDAYGLFIDVVLAEDSKGEIEQRFRWIPAGSFMMGSPNSYDGEDYHQVTHTKGYWLADTIVKQRLWQAVMENNSVEKVSWDDVQVFLNKLKKKTFDLQLRLPTESEWEYACQAGVEASLPLRSYQVARLNSVVVRKAMQDEFHFVQVKEDEDLAIESLSANQWGLYEMRDDDVYEWCADAWQKSLGKQSVVDPYQQGKQGTYRVVRRGLTFERFAFLPHRLSDSNYINIVGFRLFLGRKLFLR